MWGYEEKVQMVYNLWDKIYNQKILNAKLLLGTQECSEEDYPTLLGPCKYVSISPKGIEALFLFLDINLSEDFVENEGSFCAWFELKGKSGRSRFLENSFKNPLEPTELELEEFYLEHGFFYPLNLDNQLVHPLTGEVL